MVSALWGHVKHGPNPGPGTALTVGPGEHWWIHFRNRHPKVTFHRADMLECSRAEALNPSVIFWSFSYNFRQIGFQEQTSPDF